MSSADQAQEPTMDEILASIRRIIADEPTVPAVEEPAQAPEDILDLTQELTPAQAPQDTATPQAPQQAPQAAQDDVFNLENPLPNIDPQQNTEGQAFSAPPEVAAPEIAQPEIAQPEIGQTESAEPDIANNGANNTADNTPPANPDQLGDILGNELLRQLNAPAPQDGLAAQEGGAGLGGAAPALPEQAGINNPAPAESYNLDEPQINGHPEIQSDAIADFEARAQNVQPDAPMQPPVAEDFSEPKHVEPLDPHLDQVQETIVAVDSASEPPQPQMELGSQLEMSSPAYEPEQHVAPIQPEQPAPQTYQPEANAAPEAPALTPMQPQGEMQNADNASAGPVEAVSSDQGVAPAPQETAPAAPASPIDSSPIDTSFEQGIKDLLKPMLRDWLDDNMPRIIAGAVKEEMSPKKPD